MWIAAPTKDSCCEAGSILPRKAIAAVRRCYLSWMSRQLFDFCRGLARIIGVTAVDEIAAAGSKPVIELAACFVGDAARSAWLNVALQIDEGAIGADSDLAHVNPLLVR